MTAAHARSITLAWVAVAGLAACGYVSFVAPAEGEIRSLKLAAQESYELASRNEALLRQSTGLLRARDRVRQDVDRLQRARSGQATVALLRAVDTLAVRDDVTFGGLVPEGTTSTGGEQLTLTVRGGYASVVAFVANVTRQNVLLEVRQVDLSRDTAPDGSAGVVAVVHAILYQRIASLASPTPEENESALSTDPPAAR